jgi:hypothetical protein
MPDVYGKYSLTELAKLLNCTPAFINRIQRETGVGGKLGIKGEPRSFTETERRIFQKIMVYRNIRFSFKEIKDIWNVEEKIISTFHNLSNEKYHTEKWNKSPLIIHPGDFYNPHRALFSTEDKTVEDKGMQAYLDAVKKLRMIAEEAKRRGDIFIKEVEEEKAELERISVSWQAILESASKYYNDR